MVGCMANEDLLASWDRTRGHLARAWTELPLGVSTELYQEFVDHNELALAMEALADARASREVGAVFWEALAEAADEMHLDSQAGSYRQRSADCG